MAECIFRGYETGLFLVRAIMGYETGVWNQGMKPRYETRVWNQYETSETKMNGGLGYETGNEIMLQAPLGLSNQRSAPWTPKSFGTPVSPLRKNYSVGRKHILPSELSAKWMGRYETGMKPGMKPVQCIFQAKPVSKIRTSRRANRKHTFSADQEVWYETTMKPVWNRVWNRRSIFLEATHLFNANALSLRIISQSSRAFALRFTRIPISMSR